MAIVPPSPDPRRWPLLVVPLAMLAALLWWLRAPAPARETPTADPTTPTAPALTGPRDRPTLTLDPRRNQLAAISGTITDKKNHPIPGARVCARPQWDALAASDRRGLHCSTTDRAGRYRISDLLGVDHRVLASAAGHIPAAYERGAGAARRSTVVLRPATDLTGIDIRLEGGGVEIHGTVKDLSGGPIEAAVVSAHDGVAFTDADGQFAAWVRPGATHVTAEADGYTSGYTSGAAPGHHFEVFLTPESVLVGKVVRADDGSPVADALVAANGRYSEASYTDAGGNFRIDRLQPGPYKPEVTADAWFGRIDEQVILGLGETSGPLIIKAHPATFIEGTVVNAACDNGWLSLEERAQGRYHVATREPDGNWRARGLLPGDYEVSIRCEGFVAEEKYPHVIVAAAPISGLRWPVHPGQTIRGKVVDATGNPIARARVSASSKPDPTQPRAQQTGASFVTGDDGRFELAGLLPGAYQLRTSAFSPPRATPPKPLELSLPKGQDLGDITIELPATGELRGTLRTRDGKPIVRVDISVHDGVQSQSVVADDEGRFHFPHLAAGDYRVTARRGWNDPLRAPGTSDDDVQGTRVRVEAGQTASVALVVEARSNALHGVVRDSGGSPVADAFIDVTRESDSAAQASAGAARQNRWNEFGSTPRLTDVDGRFHVDGLGAGKHTVRAFRRGGGEAIAEHVEIGSDLVLVIAETGRLAGTIAARGGPPPEEFSLSLRDELTGFNRSDRFFRTDGRWSLAELPGGKYRLTVTAGTGTAETTVDLAAGQELADVRLELAPRVTVRGTLIDFDGQPAAGLYVSVGMQRGGAWDSGASDKQNVSDAAGRFEVPGAPPGKIMVTAWPPPSSDFAYVTHLVVIDDSPTTELPPIRVPRKRVQPGDAAGDLGYRLKDPEPGADPMQRRLIVAVVRPGGPAATAGLKPGDEITSIDGEPIGPANVSIHYQLTNVPVGTVVNLGLARGATLAVTAAAKP